METVNFFIIQNKTALVFKGFNFKSHWLDHSQIDAGHYCLLIRYHEYMLNNVEIVHVTILLR